MDWFIWAIVLLIQNASFTWVSRARNSGSISYHAIAAVFSNGIWFASQVIVIGKIMEAFASKDYLLIVLTGCFYTFLTVLGSIGSHYVLMTYFEKGSRKVGG